MTDHGLDHVNDLSLPIALRRARRTGTGIGTVRRTAAANKSKNPPLLVACTLTTREPSPPTPPTTPLQRNWKKNKKTARDIRSNKRQHLSSGLEDELSLSTGLTPMVRRTSLQPQSPAAVPGSSKCTTSHIQSCSSRQQKLVSSFSERISKSNNRSNNINNIRRNVSLTMTEKMNRAYNERRKKEKDAQEEIERLKAELKEKNERIEGLTKKEVVAVSDGKGKGREMKVAVRQQPQQQQQRSPETPSNSNRSTFHTALSIQRRSGSTEDLGGNGGQGSSGQGQQHHKGLGMPLQNNNDSPSSGSDTEGLSFTTSQFGEAIRAQLDCSTPPSSGRSRPAARYYHPRPHPLPTPGPTTTTTTTIATALVAHGELPITPCSNSRHDLDSRRTSNASTIRLQNSINDDTPSRSRTTGSVAAATAHHHHHQHHQLQLQHRTSSRPSSKEIHQQPQQQQHPLKTQQPPNSPDNDPHPQSPDLQTLLTTNTTLRASLAHTQSSLRVALQTVTKFQIETEKLQNDLLLLKQEKRELLGVVTDVQACLRKAVHKRDELWKTRMGRLRDGLVEGVREVFADFIEEPGGLDCEMRDVGVEGEGGGEGRRGEWLGKRKRGGREEEEDDGEGEREKGDGNESCDIGSKHWRSAGGGSTSRDSYDDGLEDMERRIMKMRARMMRKRRRGITGYVTAEVDSDPDA